MEKSVTEHNEIKKMRTNQKEKIESLPPEKANNIEWLIDAIGASGLEEFMEYIHSPWKMLWPNFVAWVARGFGALVWATIVIALVWWTLSTIIDLPLIGKKLEPYVEDIRTEFNKYTEANNYRPHFERIENTLQNIDKHIMNQDRKIIIMWTGTVK